MIEKLRIDLHLNTRVDADMLADGGFDNIIIATGISPRVPELEGINHPSVVGYVDALRGPNRLATRWLLWAQAALALMLPISFPMTALGSTKY